MKTHTTLGPLASIEGHTPDGRFYTLEIADVEAERGWLFWPGGKVLRCHLFANTPDLVHDDKGKLDLVYPTKTHRLRLPRGATRDTADRTYTALHEGRPMASYWDDQRRVGGSLAKDALIIDAVSYVKQTNDSPADLSLYLYRHKIELSENSKPTLAISKDQELWFRNQDSVHVTERGIEDIMTSGIKRSGDSRPNPLTQENIQRAAVSSFMAGGAALLWSMGVDYGFDMLPASVQPTLHGYTGAAIRAGLGVVTAVVVDSYVPPEYRPVAAGIGVGGIMGGGVMAINEYRASASRTAVAWPASFPNAAAYDAFVAENPLRTGTAPARPPAGVGSAGVGAPFHGQFGQQQRVRRTG